ncbi:hypothetical protein Agub_g10867 [Astrephomene gubernaculifera]|uniref:GST N-terminal domain-containing protein n=1 Tax=Astrephomene gubernaculifera TaxID=47775 RepID=A0AAD3DXE3_9CHLO|nr:hypothetical protein Agub_g10867 [Astrephomene gubernaculifera]
MLSSSLCTSRLSRAFSSRRTILPAKRPRSAAISTMASSTVVYVKGDPATKTLGDCPFCHRALLTFEAKKVPYTLEYIDFDNKPTWLQEVSGGKVPVIKEEGQPYMPDSDVIVVHLEDKYPEPPMKSSVPPEIGAKLFPAFRGWLLGPESEAADKRALLLAELQGVDKWLSENRQQGEVEGRWGCVCWGDARRAAADQGPLFGGSRLNATDASLAPKLYHIAVALKHFKGWQIPEELKAVHSYLSAVKQLPEWQHTDYGEAAIIRGWQRHMQQQHH